MQRFVRKPSGHHMANESQVCEDRARRSVFPFVQSMSSGGTFEYMGLQKRELFAAMAMQALLTNPTTKVSPGPGYTQEQALMAVALKCADELLAALQVSHE